MRVVLVEDEDEEVFVLDDLVLVRRVEDLVVEGGVEVEVLEVVLVGDEVVDEDFVEDVEDVDVMDEDLEELLLVVLDCEVLELAEAGCLKAAKAMLTFGFAAVTCV